MNLAEELLLCGIDDKGDSSAPDLVAGMGGAVAAELVAAGRMRLDDRLVVLGQNPTGDPILDEVLGELHQPFVAKMTPAALMLSLGLQVTPQVRQRLVDYGAVVTEHPRRRWLGLPGRARYRVTPIGEEPRARLRAAALGVTAPDPRTAMLAALAGVCGLAKIEAQFVLPPGVAAVVDATEAAVNAQPLRY
jgi:hypothetical protein